MAKQPHSEDDDGTSSRVSDSMILGSGHGNMDGEKGSDSGDTREGASNMRRAATDLPRGARRRGDCAARGGERGEAEHMHTDRGDPRGRTAVHRHWSETEGAARGGELALGDGLGAVGGVIGGENMREEESFSSLVTPRAICAAPPLPSALPPCHPRSPFAIRASPCHPRFPVPSALPRAIRASPAPWQGYGHRVRLASHSNYREFVTAGGLEFYPLGGDPKVLAEYMVKNKGFLPSSRKEVLQQRKQLKSIIFSTWPACTQPDLASGGAPFRADAIIANPPVYGHTTVAEALQVPLHMFFTMPWSMTTEYPHPLAGEMPAYTGYENQLSYVVVEGLMWLGVRDFINSFRKKLKLPPIPLRNRPKMRIPFGYIWSPTLAPKPHDWGNLIDVVGFCFLNLAEHYSPPAHIQQWLDSGPPPIFIGFGSLPVSDPKGLTQKFVEALQRTGQRGILQEGWGGLGKMETPNENVLVIGNCPHDWLFPRCRAVLHHGGAGTTAAGLKAACPTTIIPFFGDQPFWGARVHAAGVGPEPIPIGSLTLDKIVAAIEFMIRDEVVAAARELAGKIAREDGVDGAVEAFHKHLPPGYHSQEQCTPWLEASPGADYGSDCSCWPWSCGDAGEEEEEEKKS
ncbi:unnamed protein product [Closterium sp. Naga37s-1]|nr:unnamed protein product [Closterium sp. Naga37s-1]